MKTVLLIVGVAALAACTPKAENTTETANTMTTTDTTTTNTAAAWTGFEPGTYVVTDDKGVKVDFTINSDGTFNSIDGAGKKERGTFAMKGAKGCFTAKGAAEMCYTNAAPAADGSWTSTGDDGSTAKIVKKHP